MSGGVLISSLFPVCLQPDDGQCVPEAHVVMHMTVDDFITLIHGYIQVGEAAAVLLLDTL